MAEFSLWNPTDEVIFWMISVVLQISIVTGVALLVSRGMAHYPAARYWVLFSAMALILFSPVTALLPQWTGWAPLSTLLGNDRPQLQQEVSSHSLAFAVSGESIFPQQIAMGLDRWQFTDRILRPVVSPTLAIWLALVLLLLLRIVRGYWGLLKIMRNARPLDSAAVKDCVAETCQELGLPRPPLVVISDQLVSPVAAGIWQPRIILPSNIQRLAPHQIRAILTHEIAHILRRDPMFVVVQSVIAAAFWFHPLVHLANRQLARAREEICDNYVLKLFDGAAYVRTLLSMAELAHHSRPLPLSVGLLTSRWKLESRAAGILDERRTPVTHLTKYGLAGVLFLAGLIMTVSLTSTFAVQPRVKPSATPQQQVQQQSQEIQLADGELVDPTSTTRFDLRVADAAPDNQTLVFDTAHDGSLSIHNGSLSIQSTPQVAPGPGTSWIDITEAKSRTGEGVPAPSSLPDKAQHQNESPNVWNQKDSANDWKTDANWYGGRLKFDGATGTFSPVNLSTTATITIDSSDGAGTLWIVPSPATKLKKEH